MSYSPSSTPKNRLSPLPLVDLSLPKNGSPLNPNSTPTNKPLPLPPSHDDFLASSQSPRERKISGVSDTGAVTQSTADVDLSTLSLPITFDSDLRSTFRERSRSPGRSGDLTQGPEAILSSSWWSEKHFSRPWHDSPKRKHTVPKEQTEAFNNTRTKVAQAVSSSLGVASSILYETLFIGVDLIDLAPLPGLALAAKTLLNIWNAAQQIDMYRLACLRLTERCADMLISIRLEVHEAGDVVAEELVMPVSRLEESYLSIHRFMLKQIRRPWLKRYLNRSAIVQDIADCGADLHDALSLFNVSIQTRILKAVKEAEKQQRIELQALASSILRDRQLPSNPNTSLLLGIETQMQTAEPISDVTSTQQSTETTSEFATSNALGLIGDSDELGIVSSNETPEIIPELRTIHEAQNSLDTVHDLSDLRQIMRAALQTGSDLEMLEVLQIKRQEMPDAVKALQRELERLAELDGGTDQPIVVVSKVVKEVSLEDTEIQGRPKRSTTIISIESGSSSGDNTGESSSKAKRRDTLDQEFIENGIDALWRMSRGFERVPNWTITQFEIDRDEKVGIGFFSDVYKGRWRGRTVAIKVLAECTPRKLFVREVGIWKNLRHSNVLPLYGASSTAGDPPWFLVSPYLKNGSLVEHLKKVEHESRPPGLGIGSITNPVSPTPLSPLLSRSPGLRAISLPAFPDSNNAGDSRESVKPQSGENNHIRRQWDLFRFMHEISKGMEYLHGKGVLHGDLKAANVLVDDKYRCLISDFGQSEMKSEVYRISGTMPPHGTLRWQSPELMAGKIQMAAADDVWAFSICCVEILSMGRMPWPLMDDNAVRHFVLQKNARPPTPRNSRFNTPGLQDILRACWNTKPDDRPPFSRITRDIKLLRKGFGHDVFDSPMLPTILDVVEPPHSPSPDMRPQKDLPNFIQATNDPPPKDVLDSSLVSGVSSPISPTILQHQENTVTNENIKMPEPAIYTSEPASRTSSMHFPPTYTEGASITVGDLDGYESPPPVDEITGRIKNERRYRLLLTHDHHPSLTLPLWSPTPVYLGAVGYLSKPEGRFITLFNAYDPPKSSHASVRKLPSIDGYGHSLHKEQHHDVRKFTQKALDFISGGSLTFGNTSRQVARRYSLPLKAGHKIAYLFSEITQYEYMETVDAPKKWFQLHVDTVMQAYGLEHRIQREDLLLVVGALRVPNYGLFVSHSHPEGHVHLSVYSSQKVGQPWGTFTTDSDFDQNIGPHYDDSDEREIPRLSAGKVSNHGEPWTAVLLSRLRFKPDALEPTLKK